MAFMINKTMSILQTILEIGQNLNPTRFSGLLTKEICTQCFSLQYKMVLLEDLLIDTKEDIALLISVEDSAKSCLNWLENLLTKPSTVFLTGDEPALVNIANFKLICSKLMGALNGVEKRLGPTEEAKNNSSLSSFDVDEVFRLLVMKFELSNDDIVLPSQPVVVELLEQAPPSPSATAAAAAVVSEPATSAATSIISAIDSNNSNSALKSKLQFLLPPSSTMMTAAIYQETAQLAADHIQQLLQNNDNDILLALQSIHDKLVEERNQTYHEIMHQKHVNILIPRLLHLTSTFTLFDEVSSRFILLQPIVIELLFMVASAWDLKIYGRDCPTDALQRLVASAGEEDEEREGHKIKLRSRMIAAVILLHFQTNQINLLCVDLILQSNILELCLASLQQHSHEPYEADDEYHQETLYKCLFWFAYYKIDKLNARLVAAGFIPVLINNLNSVAAQLAAKQREYVVMILRLLIEHSPFIADEVFEHLTFDRLVPFFQGTSNEQYFAATLIAHISTNSISESMLNEGEIYSFLLKLLDGDKTQAAVSLVHRVFMNIGFDWLTADEHEDSIEPFIVRIILLLRCEEEEQEKEKLECTLSLVQLLIQSIGAQNSLYDPLVSLIQSTQFDSIRERAEHILLDFSN